MPTSEAVTRGIRVLVYSEYSTANSQPESDRWVFVYTVIIANEGQEPVQLLTRHWIITDAAGETHEVNGPGVVGQQPVLEPGQSFDYTSGCPLSTPFGSMRGTYQMVTAAGERFDVQVATFEMKAPFSVH
jgi:ApaG protein